jgi:hypothetical protein
MTTVLIALVLLVVAVGVIYWLLKSMGEDGIEIAAPGSCKSGRCGVQRTPVTDVRDEQEEDAPDEADAVKRKEAA